MIFKVEKRRFRKNGKLQMTRCYYLRYRFGDMPADFHALRYTCVTWMRRNGIPDSFVTRQVRHQNIRQTDGYTDATQMPIYESVKNLPRLGVCTQIRAQILVPEGQNVSQAVATSEGMKTHKSIDSDGLCPALSLPVAESELERAKGFEPSTLTLAT